MTPTLKHDKLSNRITGTASVDGVNPRKWCDRGLVQERLSLLTLCNRFTLFMYASESACLGGLTSYTIASSFY